jgi:hypothetical protein
MLFTQGCTQKYVIKIDSISDASININEHSQFYFTSGSKTLSQEDLHFREFSAYFKNTLIKKGYTETKDLTKANYEILFDYGISEGENVYFTYSQPIYEFTGGETITLVKKTTDGSGTPSETVTTVYVPARQHLIGHSTEVDSQVVYSSFVSLEAKLLDQEQKSTRTAWKSTIRYTGTTNDLRKLMPYFAVAASDYLAQNTNQEKLVTLKEGDLRVIKLINTPATK